MFRVTKNYLYLVAAVFSLALLNIGCGDSQFSSETDEQLLEADLQSVEEVNENSHLNQLTDPTLKPQDPGVSELGGPVRLTDIERSSGAGFAWEYLPGHPKYKTPEQTRDCIAECQSPQSIGAYEIQCIRELQKCSGCHPTSCEGGSTAYECCVLLSLDLCINQCDNIFPEW